MTHYFVVEEFVKDSFNKEILFLEQEGFIIDEDSGHRLMAVKKIEQGIFNIYLEQGGVSFSYLLYSVIGNFVFTFSTVIFHPLLEKLKIDYVERKLSLMASLVKNTLFSLKSIGCKIEHISNSHFKTTVTITHKTHRFQLAFHIDPDNIRALIDTNTILFQIIQEEIIDKNTNFLSDKYTKIIKSKLSELIAS